MPCIVAAIYTVWYMHFGTAYKNEGALSTIGLERRGYFVIWGVLTIAALCINITLAYKRYTKTKAYIPLLVISAIGMIMTLCFDFDLTKGTILSSLRRVADILCSDGNNCIRFVFIEF